MNERHISESGIVRFVVDYDQTLEQMIVACCFNFSTCKITAERFPVVGKGVVEFEARYLYYRHVYSSDEAIRKIGLVDAAKPWMPAKIEHVLAYGKTFPDEQRKFPIVGPGSVVEVDCFRQVPLLDGTESERNLYLVLWSSTCAFANRLLVVREVPYA